mmetsp:Transcript_49718/g.153548  ORF Transcript_49718/g.153548 Transcript_49718/m.153548 type:complete len:620 (+) Transcript_49718:393-2252(+)
MVAWGRRPHALGVAIGPRRARRSPGPDRGDDLLETHLLLLGPLRLSGKALFLGHLPRLLGLLESLLRRLDLRLYGRGLLPPLLLLRGALLLFLLADLLLGLGARIGLLGEAPCALELGLGFIIFVPEILFATLKLVFLLVRAGVLGSDPVGHLLDLPVPLRLGGVPLLVRVQALLVGCLDGEVLVPEPCQGFLLCLLPLQIRRHAPLLGRARFMLSVPGLRVDAQELGNGVLRFLGAPTHCLLARLLPAPSAKQMVPKVVHQAAAPAELPQPASRAEEFRCLPREVVLPGVRVAAGDVHGFRPVAPVPDPVGCYAVRLRLAPRHLLAGSAPENGLDPLHHCPGQPRPLGGGLVAREIAKCVQPCHPVLPDFLVSGNRVSDALLGLAIVLVPDAVGLAHHCLRVRGPQAGLELAGDPDTPVLPPLPGRLVAAAHPLARLGVAERRAEPPVLVDQILEPANADHLPRVLPLVALVGRDVPGPLIPCLMNQEHYLPPGELARKPRPPILVGNPVPLVLDAQTLPDVPGTVHPVQPPIDPAELADTPPQTPHSPNGIAVPDHLPVPSEALVVQPGPLASLQFSPSCEFTCLASVACQSSLVVPPLEFGAPAPTLRTDACALPR